MTGLLNRWAREGVLKQGESGQRRFTFPLLDLDGLKGVNDAAGHAQGDKVLRVFAATLAVELETGAALYRIGGDEFMVVDGAEVGALQAAVEVAVRAARQVAPLSGVTARTEAFWARVDGSGRHPHVRRQAAADAAARAGGSRPSGSVLLNRHG